MLSPLGALLAPPASSSLSPRGPGLPDPEAPSSSFQPNTKLGGSCPQSGSLGPTPLGM